MTFISMTRVSLSGRAH